MGGAEMQRDPWPQDLSLGRDLGGENNLTLEKTTASKQDITYTYSAVQDVALSARSVVGPK